MPTSLFDISREDEIIRRLKAVLSDITRANGYHTEAGLNVFRGRVRGVSEYECPCLIIHEAEDGVADQSDGRIGAQLPVEIEGFVTCDPDNPNAAAHLLLADVRSAVFGRSENDALQWGRAENGRPLALATAYIGRTFNPRPDSASVTSVTVRIRIDYQGWLSPSKDV